METGLRERPTMAAETGNAAPGPIQTSAGRDTGTHLPVGLAVNADGSLAATVIRMQGFFRDKGYDVPQDFPLLTFRLLGSTDAEHAAGISSFDSYAGIFSALLVKNPKEAAAFPEDYKAFLQHERVFIKEKDAQKKAFENAVEKSRKRQQNLDARIDKKQQELADIRSGMQTGPATIIDMEKAARFEKTVSKVDASYRKLFGDLTDYRLLRDMHFAAAGVSGTAGEEIEQAAAKAGCERPENVPPLSAYTPKKTDDLMQHLKSALGPCLTMPDAEALLLVIGSQRKLLLAIEKGRKSPESKQKRLEADIAKAEKERENIQKKLDDLLRGAEPAVIKKAASENHRQAFDKASAHNAVQTLFDSDPVFSMVFSQLTEADRQRIRGYIEDNARKFRTRMTRNIRTGHRLKLRMSETVKKACASGGIPLQLVYEKPRRQKAKLILFLDVSGSCREASEMMIAFMSAMCSVFPGGCKTYAFVNSLYDISDILYENQGEAAFKGVLNTIPTRGVYSDYYTPLKEFYEGHMSEITKDTIIIWIGDARNNANNSGEDYFRAMARKARTVFWMNTEPFDDWDTGDSIIGTYRKYTNAAAQVTTTGELIGFLMGMR